MFEAKQALDWGGCGRQRSLAGYKANPTSFLYQANFLGLGRGRPTAKSGRIQSKSHLILVPSKLPRPRQRPARPDYVRVWLRAVCAARITPVFGSAQCARPELRPYLASRSVRGLNYARVWLRAVTPISSVIQAAHKRRQQTVNRKHFMALPAVSSPACRLAAIKNGFTFAP